MTSSPIRIPAADLPSWLAGDWSIDRDIDKGRGSFAGTATFAAEADGSVRWTERGELRLDGHVGSATRTLFLHAASPWEVRFDDDALFHPLDLSDGSCAVEHFCGPDVYRGTFESLGPDELLVRWQVTGPGREDSIVSRYRRIAGGGLQASAKRPG